MNTNVYEWYERHVIELITGQISETRQRVSIVANSQFGNE